ncbi:MAG: LptF/LptG family permease [Planctomycetes bacterium]|nr:LptF/LptG family permease [Planctomycetota bacterium]
MKRLDRYVAGTFATSYVVSLVGLIAMFLLSEVVSKVDDVMRTMQEFQEDGIHLPVAWMAAEFYLLQAVLLFLHVGPFVVLFAGIFTVANLQRGHELVPMITAGRSLRRILLPVVVLALLAAGAMALVRSQFLDDVARRREDLEAIVFDRQPEGFQIENFWFRDQDDLFVGVEHYEAQERRIDGLTLHRVVDEETTETLYALQARWEPEKRAWLAVGEFGRYGKGVLEEGEAARILEPPAPDAKLVAFPWTLRFEPDDLRILHRYRALPLDLSYAQLDRLEVFYPEDGTLETLDLYVHVYPLASLILLFVGLPFCLRLERYNVFEGLGIGFLVCFLYFAIDFILRDLGMRQVITPTVACFAPVVLFGSLGLAWMTTLRS